MIKLQIKILLFLFIHSLELKFNFQLTLFISNFAPRITQFKISHRTLASQSEIAVYTITLYLRREYHLKVRLRKFDLLNTNLVVETLREITNNFAATKIVKSLSKHTQLQKTISVRHHSLHEDKTRLTK